MSCHPTASRLVAPSKTVASYLNCVKPSLLYIETSFLLFCEGSEAGGMIFCRQLSRQLQRHVGLLRTYRIFSQRIELNLIILVSLGFCVIKTRLVFNINYKFE
jgi:hypothetical protein